MMMLLQWPWFSRSPSRNQTPGTICFTVPGCAPVVVTKNASEARVTNVPRIQMRFFIHHTPVADIPVVPFSFPETPHRQSAHAISNRMLKSRLPGGFDGCKSPPRGGCGGCGRCQGGRQSSDRRPVHDQY